MVDDEIPGWFEVTRSPAADGICALNAVLFNVFFAAALLLYVAFLREATNVGLLHSLVLQLVKGESV